MADWYDTALKEFKQDLWTFNEVAPEAADKIYNYLCEIGLIDYDTEKEYLWDNYADEG